MLINTRGLVLKTTKYSETSIIARVFTREKGVQSIMLKGVRSAKAKNKAAIWHPGNLLEMVLYFQSGKNLKNVKEYKLYQFYQNIHGDMLRSALLMFLTEVLNAVLNEEDDLEDTEIYEFIESQYLQLNDNAQPDANFHLRFLLDLSQYLGIYPKDDFSNQTPYFNFSEGSFSSTKSIQALEQVASENLYKLMSNQKTELNANQRAEIIDGLLHYYRFQLGDLAPIRSHLILHQVFN